LTAKLLPYKISGSKTYAVFSLSLFMCVYGLDMTVVTHNCWSCKAWMHNTFWKRH